jgi:hypothetical protein
MPRAPKPALSFPWVVNNSKKGKSVGTDGTGLNFPCQYIKREKDGSPSTSSSFRPLSTYFEEIRKALDVWMLHLMK